MMNSEEKFFTFIINIIDKSSLSPLLDSIYDYEEYNNAKNGIASAQCIVVDSRNILKCDEEIISEKYKDDILIIQSDSDDISDIYDACEPYIEGKYVSFIDNTMFYDANTLQYIQKKLSMNEKKALSVCPVFVDPNFNNRPYPIVPPKGGYYDALHSPGKLPFFFGAYFWEKDLIKELGFNKKIVTEKDKDFIIRYVLQYNKIHYIKSKKLYYRSAAENEFATNTIQYKKEWYQEDVEGYLYNLAKSAEDYPETKKRFILCCVYYLLFSRFNCNSNDRNKKVLTSEEIDRFYEAAGKVFAYIPDFIMLLKMQIGKFAVIRNLRYFLLNLKYKSLGKEYRIIDNSKQIYIYSELNEAVSRNYIINSSIGKYLVMPDDDITENDLPVKKISKKDDNYLRFASEDVAMKKLIDMGDITAEKIIIAAVNYENGNIEIDAKSTLVDFLEHDDITLVVTVNGDEFALKPVKCYPYLKCFGRVFLKKYQFHVSVPVALSSYIKVRFFYEREGKKYSQKLAFNEAASRLTNKIGRCYWNFDKNRLMFFKSPNTLIIRKAGELKLINRERNYLKTFKAYLENKNLWDKQKSLYKLRVEYQIKKRLYKNKRIWVSFDKLYKAGDNGEYMYHYLKNHKELGITPYYIVNADSPDYERLKAAGENVLISNSYECKLICLLAEVILATHATIWEYCGFNKTEREYFKDLFNAKLVCIQHGLTVQQIAQYQNRLFDNTQFYCCASKYEVENILQPIYGYRPEQIALTGLARYDGLKNNDQKVILITPTWRRDIVNNSIAYIKKSHNNHFKESVYFKIYNSLINDKKLINKAKEKGYEIVFLLHPAMSAQSVDYDRNDYVKIVEATSDVSYEKILTEASLMVTDYSGVQFDFAYMRKPIVYYHPAALPPFYEESIYQYDSMAFGEICTEHNEIIDTLCEYMDNDCRCKDKYIKRADDFFEFDDFNSCERIYNAVDKFVKNS